MGWKACALSGHGAERMCNEQWRNRVDGISGGAQATGDAQQQWVADLRTGCRALDADFSAGDSIQWQGACVGGLVSGSGTLSFLNNGKVLETLIGTFGSGALLPGHSSAAWSDGSKFDGNQSNGQFDGVGQFMSASGDKINGQWKTGALNGNAVVIWANGDRYDGNWKDGKSDGQGTEIWANGDRFEGLWKDGAPVRQETAGQVSNITAPPSITAAAPPDARSQAPHSSETSVTQVATAPVAAATVPAQATWAAGPLHDMLGKTLIAVDGSTVGVDQSDGGLVRVVTLPTGVSQQTFFQFMNERIGTVSSESAAIGLFRVGEDEIDTNYVDGKIEVMKVAAAGGILMTSHSPDGNLACTAWYPEGHTFSQEEKKAAVAEYASRLGISEPAISKKHRAAPVCGGGFVTDVAASNATVPDERASAAPIVDPAFAAPSQPTGLQAVPVKVSAVHLIDTPYVPAIASKAVQEIKLGVDATGLQAAQLTPVSQAAAPAVPDVSQCLSVADTGGYWGFQNRCNTAVQFAYCEMSDLNPLTTCSHTSVSGSVAAQGFSALVNETSLSAQGNNHEFRWMACDGGAGEVVPHLDSFSPPSGRCLRAVPAEPAANSKSAGL